MAPRKRTLQCAVEPHDLTDPVVETDEHIINFIKKVKVGYISSEKMCRTCRERIRKVYGKKYERAKKLMEMKKQWRSISSLRSSESSSSTNNVIVNSESLSSNNPSQSYHRNVSRQATHVTGDRSQSSIEEERPMTSAQAAANRRAQEANRIAAMPTRRTPTLVQANIDVMSLYLEGITGG